MKPRYIFSAVIAVCILLGSFLPRLASPRVTAAALPAQAAVAARAATAAWAARANAHSTVPTTVPGLVMDSLPTAAPTTSPTLEPTAVPPSPTPDAGPIPVGLPADPAALEQAAPAVPAVQPDLAGFAASITNGQVDTVVGIYIDGLFSLPVLQQPPGDDAYVSNENYAVTQYAWPSKYGTIALLAHNTLSGRIFFKINANQDIILIFGDGRMAHYRMKEVQNYQALSPTDTHSDFVDLNGPGQTILTHEELFQRIYTTPSQLVLQTCFEANGDPSWGRMFVVAEPIN